MRKQKYSRKMIRECKRIITALRLLIKHPELICDWEWMGDCDKCSHLLVLT